MEPSLRPREGRWETVAPLAGTQPFSRRTRWKSVLGFQRLDVYRCAVRFLGLAASLATRLPRGNAELSDQLRRAALSIPLNIAEGSGKEGRDAARFYGIARGSALECAAVLDAMEALGLIVGDELSEERELVERIVAMLTKMRPVAR